MTIMSTMRHSVASALLALFGGLVDASDPCSSVNGRPAFTLGTGNLAYQPVVSGEMLGAHYGPQGGYHVYGSLLTSALYPGSEAEIDRYFNDSAMANPGLNRLNPVVSYTVVDLNGNEVADRKLQEPLLPQGDSESRYGDLVFFKQGTTAADIEGKVVSFSATVTDLCRKTLSDEVVNMTLTIQTPPP